MLGPSGMGSSFCGRRFGCLGERAPPEARPAIAAPLSSTLLVRAIGVRLPITPPPPPPPGCLGEALGALVRSAASAFWGRRLGERPEEEEEGARRAAKGSTPTSTSIAAADERAPNKDPLQGNDVIGASEPNRH